MRTTTRTLIGASMMNPAASNQKLYDVDMNNGSVMIRHGKGNKDRLIAIGERACAWIGKYLDDVRPGYVMEPDDSTVFLAEYGEPLRKGRLTDLVRKYLDAAGITKPGSCHLFRHTMATLMLENGAGIRYIQAMLGHSTLSTTEIHTPVSIRKLKEIHTATHPARLRQVGHHGDEAGSDGTPAKQALLTALAAEADEAKDP